MSQKKFVDFAEVCITAYVRQSLDEDRVHFFEDMYTSSAAGTIPPMIITTENKLVDGRHRMQALKNLHEKGAVFEIVRCADNLELVMAAMKANVGGSKELKQGDIRQAVMMLLAQGFKVKRIVENLPFPKELSKRFVDDAHSAWHKQKLTAACAALRKGDQTIEEICKDFCIKKESLLAAEKKRKRKEDQENDLSNVGSTKGAITHKYYSMTKRMGNYIKRIMVNFEAGDFTDAQVLELMAHITHQARIHTSAMEDWKNRVQVQIKTREPLPMRLPRKKFVVDESLGAML